MRPLSLRRVPRSALRTLPPFVRRANSFCRISNPDIQPPMVAKPSSGNLRRPGQCHRIGETVRKLRHRQTSQPLRPSAPLLLPRHQPSTCPGLQCPNLGRSIRHRHQTHPSASARRQMQSPLVCSHQTRQKGRVRRMAAVAEAVLVD